MRKRADTVQKANSGHPGLPLGAIGNDLALHGLRHRRMRMQLAVFIWMKIMQKIMGSINR